METNHRKIEHPLFRHKLTLMRDPDCGTSKFRQLMHEITLLMSFELTRYLPTDRARVRSNGLEGDLLTGPKPILVPILLAGMGMVDALLDVMPSARVGHIGLYRRKNQLTEYLISLPSTLQYNEITNKAVERVCIVLDPVIGTGSVASRAIQIIKNQEVSEANITFCSIVAAPLGLAKIAKEHPGVRVFYVDEAEGLDEDYYVVPHWGDAGNRLYGLR